jgi:hypothetical protein
MEVLDLSIPTLMKACKGNVKNLPSFMVHDDGLWFGDNVQLDNKNRIHLRRASFHRSVVGFVPLRAGIWHGLGVQEFHIDLQPHHLQGSGDMAATKGHSHSRALTLTDAQGRNPGAEGYGEALPKPVRISKLDLDAARNENGGQLRGIGSTAFSRVRGE